MRSAGWTGALLGALVLLASPELRADDVGPGAAPTAAARGEPARDSVERARRHFKAGVELYRDGDLSASMVEFKRAYEAAPNYRVLFNLGQVSQELREYPEARRYFERYLREGGSAIDPARRQEVEAALARVRGRIATVWLSSDVEGAEYFVDDVAVGRGPLDEPLLVSAGRHRISAVAPGHQRVTEVLDAAGGESHQVRLRLPRLDAPAVVAEPAVASPVRAPRPALADTGPGPELWFGIGTGALAVGAGVVAYLAAQDGRDYRSALERKTSATELDALHDRATTKALVADILLGAAAVSGGLALYFAWSDDAGAAPERAHLRVGPGSVAVRGQF